MSKDQHQRRDSVKDKLKERVRQLYQFLREANQLRFRPVRQLIEHFRCVPEIIAFSNQLSYEGKIRPLRESNSTPLKPACIPYRVDGFREAETNITEAETIVS